MGWFSRLVVSGVAWVLCLYTWTARADERHLVPEQRIESVRSMALGTGVRASAISTQAQADHPANLTQGGVYHMEAFSTYAPDRTRVGVGGAVVDSMTSKLAAGLSARGLFGDEENGENGGWEMRLGLAFPLADALSIGIAGRYSDLTVTDSEALPDNQPALDSEDPPPAPDYTHDLKHFTLDVSIGLRLTQSFQLAALGYNLVDTDSPLAPRQVGGSGSFFIAGLTAGADLLVELGTYDDPKIVAGGGAEYLVGGNYPLRIGYRYDQGPGHHFVTGGLGYVDKIVGVQLGLRQRVRGEPETELMIALQYFVQ